mgnify:CR=1 FL=1|tara:strand:+ start:16 stop:567 length:552 start_codon:yes stop_codon:yes gene_type:complete
MKIKEKKIVDHEQFSIIIDRLSYELIENHYDFSETVIIGIQPRGVLLSNAIVKNLRSISKEVDIYSGNLDITFFRDDFGRRSDPINAKKLDMNFSLEGKRVVLIDDVLFTGRSVRAALDALLTFGRPDQVELLVLIDRRLKRHLPIEPNYVGMTVDSIFSEDVVVQWSEDLKHNEIFLLKNKL